MGILSPIMSYIVDKEVGFPAPTEKEKINKALKRYRALLQKHPKRPDATEIMFGIADLLVGRGESGDYSEAMKHYDQILLRPVPDYLRARTLVGKAEILIGIREELSNAISLCEKARKILKKDLSDFFVAKTFVVEAELRFVRGEANDWKKAVSMANEVIKAKDSNWYFRGRAFLNKSEITMLSDPAKTSEALKLCESALKQLKSRPADYFNLKGNVMKAELLSHRAKKGDLEKAEKILTDVIKSHVVFNDLVARAKIDLANIANHPKASHLLKQVHEMEALDPYLIEKTRMVENALREKKREVNRAKSRKPFRRKK
jgi:tetratricopeptide (TPR) repeat protein